MKGNPYWEKTVGAMLDEAAARHPDREAIVFGDERITYRDFQRQTNRLARGFLALGLERGQHVALWLPNSPAWLYAQYAAAKIGAPVVALNTRYKAHELSYILSQSDTTTLLLADHLREIDFLEILDELLPELRDAEPGQLRSKKFPLLTRIIVDAEDPYPGCLRLRDVFDAGDDPALEAALARAENDAHPDDLFTILYTSGTTSFPKGAMISHRNCLPHGWHCGEAFRLTPEDRILLGLPLSGTWGGVNIPLMTFTHAASLILMERFDAGQTLHLMEKERATVWNGVDAMILALLQHPELDRYDRSSLRTGAVAMTSGGAQSLFDEVVNRIGIPQTFQPYGMTEVNAVAMLHRLDDPVEVRKLPGVWPAPGVEVKVVDPENGDPIPPGTEGELLIRGFVVTRGYYKKPDETARAFTADGWFRTGDLAVQDEAGRTIFRGRLKDTLRISHFMVAPGEIEEFLMTHPKVLQAVVVGVPDLKLGEAPVAYIIPREGEILSEEEIMGHCKGKIASYKIPRAVRFVKDVPRTQGPHGAKVQKGKLREQAIQEMAMRGEKP
jgi:fatty-acyl-CoA synthase